MRNVPDRGHDIGMCRGRHNQRERSPGCNGRNETKQQHNECAHWTDADGVGTSGEWDSLHSYTLCPIPW